MLNIDEARVLIDFLDRVTITGHQERANMNLLIEKIVTIGKASKESQEFERSVEQKEVVTDGNS